MPPKMVKLHAPPGTDEANYGEQRFRVDNDGTVLVTPEAVEGLLATGGFTREPQPADEDKAPDAPEGGIWVMHPDGTGCSWGGTSYEPDKRGAVLVPAAAVIDLAPHGFIAFED